MRGKTTSLLVLTLLLTSMLTAAFSIRLAKAIPKTWYVDDSGGKDFTSIQAAIYQASPGDTIYVYNGTYYEHISVYKPLTFIGENRYGTVIDANGYTDTVVTIAYTYNVSFTGFTVRNGAFGIGVRYSHDNTLVGNIISDVGVRGIELYPSCYRNVISGNVISGVIGYPAPPGVTGRVAIYLSLFGNVVKDNVISNSEVGIYLSGPPETSAHDNVIEGNVISDNDMYGINIWGYSNAIFGNTITNMGYVGIQLNSPDGYPNQCTDNAVSGNVISQSTFGINLIMAAFSNTIERNQILSSNGLGILFSDSDNNTVRENLVSNAYYGILVFASDNTEVYHNNFVGNTVQALPSGSLNNAWDNGYPSGGNYWSDYADVDLYSGPDQDVAGSDGIWDHPYIIDFDNRDRYPFTEPWAPTISAACDIDPHALNLNSHGHWITAYIELPEGHDPSEINISTIKLNGTITVDPEAPTAIGDYDVDGIPDLMVKFNRTEVTDYVKASLDDIEWRFSDIAFIITGKLNDGTRIMCSYVVKAIKGDVNGDGSVDIVDLATVAKGFGTSSLDACWIPQADINRDNRIDIDDLLLVAKEFGIVCP